MPRAVSLRPAAWARSAPRGTNTNAVVVAYTSTKNVAIGCPMIPQNCAVRRRIGCYVIKDREATTRAIEFKAKLGKPTLDQPRLPLAGPNKYLGQHFPIPVGMKSR